MCQGLPCVGSTVRLIRAVNVGGMRVPKDATGVVDEEFLEARAVSVYFPDAGVTVRVSESDVTAVLEGCSTDPGEGVSNR